MKTQTIMLLALALVLQSCKAQHKLSPFEEMYISNGTNHGDPFRRIGEVSDHKNKRSYPVTNWFTVTNELTEPKIVIEWLKAPKNRTAAPGQIWINSCQVYVNTPKVFHHAADTNVMVWDSKTNISIWPEWYSTNHWPLLEGHTSLIYVREVEKLLKQGDFKGQEYYVRCRVRTWNEGITSFQESESTLLVEYLTNNATLIRP